VQPTNVDPKATDTLIDRPMAEMELPRRIGKLEPFKDRLGIIMNTLLDFIRHDVNRVRRELPSMDKEKLDTTSTRSSRCASATTSWPR
jgi:hypothetical protein